MVTYKAILTKNEEIISSNVNSDIDYLKEWAKSIVVDFGWLRIINPITKKEVGIYLVTPEFCKKQPGIIQLLKC